MQKLNKKQIRTDNFNTPVKLNLLSKTHKHICIPKPPVKPQWLISGWSRAHPRTRHMDNVSWSDQLDMLSAVSKAGCASLQEPQKTAKTFTDAPTSRPIHQSTKCHAIIIHFDLDLLLLLYYELLFMGLKTRKIVWRALHSFSRSHISYWNWHIVSFLKKTANYLLLVNESLTSGKNIVCFFELVNFWNLRPFCFRNIIFLNV